MVGRYEGDRRLHLPTRRAWDAEEVLRLDSKPSTRRRGDGRQEGGAARPRPPPAGWEKLGAAARPSATASKRTAPGAAAPGAAPGSKRRPPSRPPAPCSEPLQPRVGYAAGAARVKMSTRQSPRVQRLEPGSRPGSDLGTCPGCVGRGAQSARRWWCSGRRGRPRSGRTRVRTQVGAVVCSQQTDCSRSRQKACTATLWTRASRTRNSVKRTTGSHDTRRMCHKTTSSAGATAPATMASAAVEAMASGNHY